MKVAFSLTIAKKYKKFKFKSNPLRQQKKTDQTISMAVKQEPLKHNQEFFFFPRSEI